MVLPDLLFDGVLFGALLLAALLDTTFPSLHGAASMLAVGAATYVAAQELCDWLSQRRWWTQESLSTALSLSIAGFIYFWWRNDSDFALLVLSIGLMMASLMAAIAIIAGCGAAIKETNLKPLGGLLLTIAGALTLGILAGLLTLNTPAGIKILIICVSFIVWKLRENVRPPAQNALSQDMLSMGNQSTAGRGITPPLSTESRAPAQTTVGSPAAKPQGVGGLTFDVSTARTLTPHPSGRWALIPQRGTLLDRFLPVLLLGAVLLIAMKEAGLSVPWPSSPPASASSTTEKE